jgi:putative hydroxymethylpyrimidine transport system substrate-binding protein
MLMIRRVLLVLAACMLAMPAVAQTTKLTLLLDWFVNPDHGPLIVARENGYFREAGLDVEMIAPADPNDPPKLVAAGKADLAISYQGQLTMQAAEGLPLVRVATIVGTPLNSLLVLRDGPVKSIADLKGRKIGFSVGGFEDALLTTMLGKYGLKLGDVTLVNVNFSLSPALLTGQVDGVIGAFRNFEMNQLDIEGKPGRAFFVEEEGVPPYDELIVVANRARAKDPAFRKFVDAMERGVHFTINQPDAAWALFAKGGKELDTELNKRAWRDTIRRFNASPAALDTARYRRFGAFLETTGVIKKAPPVESYAVELP